MVLGWIVEPLLAWYDSNARVLPWREEPTPYRVWISEIMLQQTRVEAVLQSGTKFEESGAARCGGVWRQTACRI